MPPEKYRFSSHDSIYPGLSFHWARKGSKPFQECQQGRRLLSIDIHLVLSFWNLKRNKNEKIVLELYNLQLMSTVDAGFFEHPS